MIITLKSSYIYIIVIACLIAISSSCKKEEPAPQPVTSNVNGWDCDPIQGVKDFFFFKEGSWWVYQEEGSGELDTISVTIAAHDPNSYNFDIRVYSSFEDYSYHFWPVSSQSSPSAHCPDIGTICDRCLKVKRSKYKPGEFVSEATCFFYLPEVGQHDLNWNYLFLGNEVRTDSIMDSLTISGFNFGSSVRIFEQSCVMEGYQPTYHYFSRDVGLVKKELLFDAKVWNLVDFYIAP